MQNVIEEHNRRARELERLADAEQAAADRIRAEIIREELADLVTASEAADLLRVSRQRVHQYIADGRLTPVGRIGKRGTYVFRRSDVEGLRGAP